MHVGCDSSSCEPGLGLGTCGISPCIAGLRFGVARDQGFQLMAVVLGGAKRHLPLQGRRWPLQHLWALLAAQWEVQQLHKLQHLLWWVQVERGGQCWSHIWALLAAVVWLGRLLCQPGAWSCRISACPWEPCKEPAVQRRTIAPTLPYWLGGTERNKVNCKEEKKKMLLLVFYYSDSFWRASSPQEPADTWAQSRPQIPAPPLAPFLFSLNSCLPAPKKMVFYNFFFFFF